MFLQLIFSSLMIILVGIFPMLNHPLSMGVTILMLTVLLATALGTLMVNFWMSYILVLVLLGGLLVIFVYISLLVPNELFSKSNMFKMMVGGAGLLLFTTTMSLNTWVGSMDSLIPTSYSSTEGLLWLNSLYSQNLWLLTIFAVIYLLLTLIVVVNMTKHDRTSLRSH